MRINIKFEECKVGDVVYLMTELRILVHENIKRPSIIPKRFMIIDKREYSKTVEIKSLDKPSLLCYTIPKQGGTYEIRRMQNW